MSERSHLNQFGPELRKSRTNRTEESISGTSFLEGRLRCHFERIVRDRLSIRSDHLQNRDRIRSRTTRRLHIEYIDPARHPSISNRRPWFLEREGAIRFQGQRRSAQVPLPTVPH